MAYTDKPRDFFHKLAQAKPHADGLGVVAFDIEGDGGGQWTVDFSSGQVTSAAGDAGLTVRARARDFMALVEGRMPLSDGMLTDRLSLAGDVVAATRLGRFLEAHYALPRVP